MPPQETGKQRAARIPLDYYKHSDCLGKWKTRLGWLALIVPLAWLGTNFALSNQQDFYSSRGPVSAVHQTWDASCSTCHVNFTPISNHSFALPILGDAAESSKQCRTCHAGPDHFATQPDDRTCASCHREHRGHQASLVNLPDSDCTQCHKDLNNVGWGPVRNLKEMGLGDKNRQAFTEKITRFAENDHPKFLLPEKDPGKLKFNHKRHLALGMALEKDGEKGGPTQTLGMIPEAFRKRYRDKQSQMEDTDFVQLQCASCHQLDVGDFGAGKDQAQEFPFTLMGRRNAGAYMLPISYENQCQACHALDHKLPGKAVWTVPHRLQPEKIHDLLNDFFTAQFARGLTVESKGKARPLPGKLTPEDKKKIQKEVRSAEIDLFSAEELNKRNEAIKAGMDGLERNLFLGNQSCALCHYFDPKDKTGLDVPSAMTVSPTKVPSVWLPHAKFNHTAHRAVTCVDCHAQATNSTTHTDVMIPGIDNCVKCHAPPTPFLGTPKARHNCTECHRYHNGEHALQGIGAAGRNPAATRSIEGFLSGKK